MGIIVEIQGFRDENKKFFAKEVAVTCVDSDWIGHWIIKPPHTFSKLQSEIRKQNNWLTQYYHGIEWYEGDSCIKGVEHSLREICRGKTYTVYTRGHEKAKYLEEVLSRRITNLEEWDCCPSFRDLPTGVQCCSLHASTRKHGFRCALQQAMSLREWLREDKRKGKESIISSLNSICNEKDYSADNFEFYSCNISEAHTDDEHSPAADRVETPFGFYEDRSLRIRYE